MSSFKYKILINDSANQPKNLTKRYVCTHCEQEKWINVSAHWINTFKLNFSNRHSAWWRLGRAETLQFFIQLSFGSFNPVCRSSYAEPTLNFLSCMWPKYRTHTTTVLHSLWAATKIPDINVQTKSQRENDRKKWYPSGLAALNSTTACCVGCSQRPNASVRLAGRSDAYWLDLVLQTSQSSERGNVLYLCIFMPQVCMCGTCVIAVAARFLWRCAVGIAMNYTATYVTHVCQRG